jgi:addiction module HigA family antidote
MAEMLNQYEPDRVSAPGETLLESIEALGMSQAELAERLGRPKKTINEIVQAKAAITPETALELEAVLGIPAAFWMAREARYRESLARRDEEAWLATETAWARRFPVRIMAARGWIADSASRVDSVRELLRFFAVASPQAWEETWTRREVAYRCSSKQRGDRHAIAVWLRRGEIEGQRAECAPYDAERFKRSLGEARSLTNEPPDEFQPRLTALFAAAGVAVAWVPEIPRAPISGVTRWLTPERALIQVSLRYKTDDQLWFSIFHEAAHVLKHPRKLVFIEDGDQESDEEREANAFAAATLIPGHALAGFGAEPGRVSLAAVREFARQVGVAPGIVVGRLQHDGVLPFTDGNALKRRLRWMV